MAASLSCRVRETAFLGWRAVEVSNGLLRAVLTPDLGGRVIQLWLGDHPFFFVNERLAGLLFTAEEHQGDGTIASWKNYGGSKTWPAPQGWDGPEQWAGPPDPVLDGGRYRLLGLAADGNGARVAVESPPDPRTGLQIRRELTLRAGSAEAVLRREMRNVSQRPVRWSLWEVVQLDCARKGPDGHSAVRPGCWAYVPKNPASRFPAGFQVTYGPSDNPQWQDLGPDLFAVRYEGRLGKVGLDASAGWAAFGDEAGDWVFCQRFSYQPGAEYPHGGDAVEVWTHGPGVAAGVDFSQEHLLDHFLELEVLGPLVALQPGEVSVMTIEWAAARCPLPVVAAGPVGCIGRRLAVERSESGVRLRGAFGVFRPGSVRAVAVDVAGRAVATLGEWTASPLEPLHLDLTAPWPTEGRAVELRATDEAGREQGVLDRALVAG